MSDKLGARKENWLLECVVSVNFEYFHLFRSQTSTSPLILHFWNVDLFTFFL